MDEIISHLALFVLRLWQIHIFSEGNTRTTAVFFIKYLRTLGFEATNDIFAENARYFRNALVRANYTNLQKGIYETTEFLEQFLRNLLLNENHELYNRNLHINTNSERKKADFEGQKVDIQNKKVDFEGQKVDIQGEKADFERRLSEKTKGFSAKTVAHIHKIFEQFHDDFVFGRKEIAALLEIQNSSASKLIRKLLDANIIEPVHGQGKGKYKFPEK